MAKKPKGRQMKGNRGYTLPCPQCGEQFFLPKPEFDRNYNLTVTCLNCGLVHLAANAVIQSIHERMKEFGHPDLKPPIPQPIDPVRIAPAEDGFEWVFRRNKAGGERAYMRRIKPPRKTTSNG
jgi:predicted RNA-binding Zn-ribbon protein involved in translation (DUF1610 family)